MNIPSPSTSFLTENWLPNLVGLVGGLLGAYSFIDTYLIMFKPRLLMGSRVILHFADEGTNKQNLASIICSIEIFNPRKKYGAVYNLAGRIYQSDEINPFDVLYYASQIVNTIPVDITKLESEELRSFNPITISPDSNKTLNVVLGTTRFSKMHTSAGKGFYLELFYQTKPKGKWHFAGKHQLYNDSEIGELQRKFHRYILLDIDMDMDDLAKQVKPTKTHLYSGIYHRNFDIKFRSYKHTLLIRPVSYIKGIFVGFILNSKLLIDYWLDRLVMIPLLKKEGRSLINPQIKFGNPENKRETESAFEQIYTLLDLFIREINDSASQEAKIILSRKENYITLSRYRLIMKCYISGDSSIRAYEDNGFGKGRIRYTLEYKAAVWNKKYWFLENHGVISLKSFVLRLLDTIILHSNTR